MRLPDPALVVLVGASGAGKSTWAAQRYRVQEVVSSDALRGVVGSGEHDLDASGEAFAILEQVVAARIGRRLCTVVDTLGLDPVRRAGWLALARSARLPAVAVVLETPDAECRRRNATRDVPVPAPVLAGQLKRMRTVAEELAGEGWEVVVTDAGVGDREEAAVARAPRPPRTAVPRPGSGSCSRSRGSRGATTRRRGWARSRSPPTRTASPASR